MHRTDNPPEASEARQDQSIVSARGAATQPEPGLLFDRVVTTEGESVALGKALTQLQDPVEFLSKDLEQARRHLGLM